jgi:hypothetical protein
VKPCTPVPRLEAVLKSAPLSRRDLPVNAEDRADRDVHVDVRRSIEGVVDDNVIPSRELVGNRDESLVLFRRQACNQPGMIERPVDDLVREHVELLLGLTVNVLVAGRPHDIDESSLVHLPADHLRGKSDVLEKTGEGAGRSRKLPLLLDEEARNRDNVALSGHGDRFGVTLGPE